MSFWATVGKDLAKAVTFGRVIAPVATQVASEVAAATGNQTVGKVAVDLSLFQGLAATVSGQLQAVSGTAPDNAQIAGKMAPLVMTAIENSGFLDGKQVADTAKWNALVAQLSQSFLDLDTALEPAAPATGTTTTKS